jgi:hypothetical protein
MNFGDVLIGLRQGKRYTRKGWNGAKMYIYYTEGASVPLRKWDDKTEAQAITEKERDTGYVVTLPHIDMMSARGERVIGWLASQTDMLADDWEEA